MIIKGQKINDRYQIIRMIGEGGMANVYLAHDIILDRKVAVKILRGDLADDEKFVRRFQREAISASSLAHSNIVEMYDVGEDDGKYFIVMEYVDGKTLKSLIKKRGYLTLPEVIDIMLQLTSGIICAHDSYIIHRDIKPQNILILDSGQVKITDFGIAMALNSNELTQTNSVMGSVYYLPPEQANGSGTTVKSDVYSLGILMYELLTGKLPFKGENAVEIAIKHMKNKMPRIREFNEDIPQSVENIILKSCAKNPKNRYETVRKMYEDLLTCLEDNRKDELLINYKYPENDLDETKKVPNLKNLVQKTEDIIEEKTESKKLNIVLLVVSIISGLLFLIWVGIGIYTKFATVPDVSIPDVYGKKVEEAEKILRNAGFLIDEQIIQKNSSDIKKGTVIETQPSKNRIAKKGKKITLVVSLGIKTFVMQDYTGQNYNTVKASLEANGIVVKSEYKDIQKIDKYEKNVILEQLTTVGTELLPGDIVTFVIPEELIYPDFVKEKWKIIDIEDFCKKYGVTIQIEYEESKTEENDKVIYQSRSAGDEVKNNTTLKIKVIKKIIEETVSGDED